MATEVFRDRILGPVTWPFLASLLSRLDSVVDVFGCVCKLAEPGTLLRILEDFGPFTEESADKVFHLLLQIRANSELVLKDDSLQILDAAGEVLHPSRCSLQFVGCANVEGEIAV